MARALKHLRRTREVRVEAVSSLFETEPWGNVDQPAFLNAAARLSTRLRPQALLAVLLEIERTLGRDRSREARWGPRLIDLDILLAGENGTLTLDEEGLTLPHPRLAERAFAVVPLAEVWPDAVIGTRSARSRADWIDDGGMRTIDGPAWADKA